MKRLNTVFGPIRLLRNKSKRLRKLLARFAFAAIYAPMWFRSYGTNGDLSNFINDALDAGEVVTECGDYRVILAGIKFWTGNYPYYFGALYDVDDNRLRRLPDRITAYRLRRAMRRAMRNTSEANLVHSRLKYHRKD